MNRDHAKCHAKYHSCHDKCTKPLHLYAFSLDAISHSSKWATIYLEIEKKKKKKSTILPFDKIKINHSLPRYILQKGLKKEERKKERKKQKEKRKEDKHIYISTFSVVKLETIKHESRSTRECNFEHPPRGRSSTRPLISFVYLSVALETSSDPIIFRD